MRKSHVLSKHRENHVGAMGWRLFNIAPVETRREAGFLRGPNLLWLFSHYSAGSDVVLSSAVFVLSPTNEGVYLGSWVLVLDSLSVLLFQIVEKAA